MQGGRKAPIVPSVPAQLQHHWDSLSCRHATASASTEGCFLHLCAHRGGEELLRKVVWQTTCVCVICTPVFPSVRQFGCRKFEDPFWAGCFGPLPHRHTRGLGEALGLSLLCGSFPFCLWPSGRRGRAYPVSALCGDAGLWLGFGNAQPGHLLSQCVHLRGRREFSAVSLHCSCPKEPV